MYEPHGLDCTNTIYNKTKRQIQQREQKSTTTSAMYNIGYV